MKKIFLPLLLLFTSFLQAAPYRVLVSVAPYVEIVKKIGGDAVEVSLLVPEGADFHNFEPSPAAIEKTFSADMWFSIAEPFERKVIDALETQKRKILIANLTTAVPNGIHDHHFWMSIRVMIPQARFICEKLCTLCPEKKAFFEANLESTITSLQALDQKIAQLLQPSAGKSIFVAHPAYSLFCDDYHLIQLAIEGEGKEPTAKELSEMIKKAKELKVETIFIQDIYGHKGASLVAEEIGATILFLPSSSPRYSEMMQTIADNFQKAAR